MDFKNIEQGIIEVIRKAETELPEDVIKALEKAYEIEEDIAKTQIDAILKTIDPFYYLDKDSYYKLIPFPNNDY